MECAPTISIRRDHSAVASPLILDHSGNVPADFGHMLHPVLALNNHRLSCHRHPSWIAQSGLDWPTLIRQCQVAGNPRQDATIDHNEHATLVVPRPTLPAVSTARNKKTPLSKRNERCSPHHLHTPTITFHVPLSTLRCPNRPPNAPQASRTPRRPGFAPLLAECFRTGGRVLEGRWGVWSPPRFSAVFPCDSES